MLEIGAWLWVVVGAGLWLVVGPGAAAVLRMRVWRRARGRRLRLGTPTEPIGFVDGAPAVLEGCLETKGATVPRHGDDLPVAGSSVVVEDGRDGRLLAHEQAPGLSIRTGGVSVELQGRLDLQAGARERHAGLSARWVRRRLRARLPEAAREVDGRVVVRSVAPADRVRLAGSLRRVSAAEDVALYREAAARWRLVPAHEGGTLPVASAWTPRVSGPAVLVWIRRSILALVAYAAVLTGGGQLAMYAGLYDLAAMTPLRRTDALEASFRRALSRTLHERAIDPKLERLAPLPELRPRCPEAVARLSRNDLPEPAIRLGLRCGTPESLALAAEQLTILGRFDEASRAFSAGSSWGPARVAAHLGRSDLANAAGALEALVPDGSMSCITTALRARGDRSYATDDARQLLRQGATSPIPETRLYCGLLYADLLEGEDRTAFLASLPRATPGSAWDELARLLAWEADPARMVPASEEPLSIGATPSSLGYVYGPSLHVAPGLEARVSERLTFRNDPPALALRARLAVSLATLEAIGGDANMARARQGEADGLLEALAYSAGPMPPDMAEARRDVAGLAAAIELRGGDIAAARRIADERAPWQRTNLDFAIRELESIRGHLGAPPLPTTSIDRIFVRQGARLLESRLAGDRIMAGALEDALRRLRLLLLDRETAVPLAMMGLPAPTLEIRPDAARAASLDGADPDLTHPVVRRMHQVYELYGTPETPFFPIGGLDLGRSAVFPFRIAAGQCRSYVAVGGPGVIDLDLTVTTPDGAGTHDASHADQAVAHACSSTTGPVLVQIRMTDGEGAVALQSFAAVR